MSSARCAGSVCRVGRGGIVIGWSAGLGCRSRRGTRCCWRDRHGGETVAGAEQSSSQREARAAARRAAPTTRSRVTTDPTGGLLPAGAPAGPRQRPRSVRSPYALTALGGRPSISPKPQVPGRLPLSSRPWFVPQWDTAASDPQAPTRSVPRLRSRRHGEDTGPCRCIPSRRSHCALSGDGEDTSLPPVAGAIVSLPFTAERLLDTFGARLSGLPGRIGDLLSGAPGWCGAACSQSAPMSEPGAQQPVWLPRTALAKT